VKDNSALTSYISGLAPGTTVSLKLIRAGAEKSVSITLGTFPEGPLTASASGPGDDEGGREEEALAKLGVDLQTLSPSLRERMGVEDDVKGVVVRSVEAGGAAELAGLARGDIITMVSGRDVASVSEFNAAIRRLAPARAARLRVQRGETVLVVALRLDRE